MNDRAVLLGELQVQSNPPVGKKIVFGSDKSTTEQRMVQFLQQDTNGYVTFMLTADNETPQQAGWRFASYQHAFLDPPALTIE
jgi:hypothetical protein